MGFIIKIAALSYLPVIDPSMDKPSSSTISRIVKYIIFMTIILFIIVVVGFCLAIMVINYRVPMILYGQVYGLAGTDDMRRDLMVALLWGTPIALAFGFLGAIFNGVISMLIAAVSVWFGGWVDSAIQRLTEINMILPTLPIAITIYYLYSKSIWMILGVIIILSIFGSTIKTYRAAFMQVKESPYIEAAQAYGASDWRLIRSYLVPRIIPLLIPQ